MSVLQFPSLRNNTGHEERLDHGNLVSSWLGEDSTEQEEALALMQAYVSAD